jgi:hypothetical protein
MNLYNCRTIPNGGFRITKFDMNCVPIEGASYEVTNATCTCPAYRHATCKHRKMLAKFFERHHVDDGWFYNHDNGMWHRPVSLDQIPDDMPIRIGSPQGATGEGPGQSPLATADYDSPSVKLPEQAGGFKRRF